MVWRVAPIAWFVVGALLVGGVLLPAPSYRPTDELRPVLALAILPALVLGSIALDPLAPPAGRAWRLSLALGTFHFVAFDAYMLTFWTAFDFARDLFADAFRRLAFWALCVLAARLALGSADLVTSGAGWWRVLARAAAAGALLGVSTPAVLAIASGDALGLLALLPLVAFFAAPLGAAFGLGFGAIDLGLAFVARWIVRRARG